MEHKTTALLLVFLAAVPASALLWPVAGGGEQSYNPFYPFYYGFNQLGGGGGVGCAVPPFVNITYPYENQTFFFPNISPNVTFNLSGSIDPVCYYRLFIEGTPYAWNSWGGCGEGDGGVNHKIITLPDGRPVTIQVRVDDSNCRVYDAVNVNVNYGVPTIRGFTRWLPILVFWGAGIGILAYAVVMRRGNG